MVCLGNICRSPVAEGVLRKLADDKGLRLARNEDDKKKTDLLLNALFPGQNNAVPDPYYGGEKEFENVFQLIYAVCDKITDELVKELK